MVVATRGSSLADTSKESSKSVLVTLKELDILAICFIIMLEFSVKNVVAFFTSF